jgi:hypothetical protein
MGGVALQFVPSPAAAARDERWRERQLQSIPAYQKAKWIEYRDQEDSSSKAYLRLFWGHARWTGDGDDAPRDGVLERSV